MEGAPVTHPDPATRWRNMRRMAYTALLVAIIETIVLLRFLFIAGGDHQLLSASVGWIATSYLLWGGIIGAYMGVSGVADAWGFKR